MDEIENIDKSSVRYKKKKNSNDNSKFYIEFYCFGGSSFGKMNDSGIMPVDNGYSQSQVPYDAEYNNKGLGWIGVFYLSIGKNRRPDFMIDCEFAFYSAAMKVTSYDPVWSEDFLGYSECFDFHFSLFPIKSRNKYPSPYILTGLGMRFVKFTLLEGTISELHGDYLFCFGVRQKISRGFSFQLCEQFVYSKLKDFDAFIFPETRLELVFSFG